MITLITGAPGAGKTSLLVSMLMGDPDFKNRAIYVDGIPELKLPHEEIPEGKKLTDWPEWLPDTSILIVDEAQRYWRPRSNSSPVPKELQALETHRHHSWDIIFITQHPALLDNHIRRFVGRHVHINRTSLGVRKFSEWTSCKNPDSKADMKEAMKKTYKLPKETFSMYKSASEHIQLKGKSRKILPIMIFLTVLFILAGLFAVYKVSNFNNDLKSDKKKEISVASAETVGTPEPFQQVVQPMQTPEQKLVGVEPKDYVPRISERSETKPIYDSVRTVVNMEFPELCVENKTKCTCYTSQATILREIPEATCRRYVKDGIFNPYKQNIQTVAQSEHAKPPKATNP